MSKKQQLISMKTKIRKYKKLFIGFVLVAAANVAYCSTNCNKGEMNNVIHLENGCILVLDSTINLSDSISYEIISGIRSIVSQVQSLIPADSITINLKITDDVIPIWGVGGQTTSDHSLDFFYDPENPSFKIEHFYCGLVHEIMHVSRLRMPKWELTLLECMITEGLADHFSNEVLGCSRPPWSNSITSEQIEKIFNESRTILYKKHSSWNDEFNEKFFNPWMFGRMGKNAIPSWAGYSIGWEIVENYLKMHPDKKNSDLVWVSAVEIASSMSKFTTN